MRTAQSGSLGRLFRSDEPSGCIFAMPKHPDVPRFGHNDFVADVSEAQARKIAPDAFA